MLVLIVSTVAQASSNLGIEFRVSTDILGKLVHVLYPLAKEDASSGLLLGECNLDVLLKIHVSNG